MRIGGLHKTSLIDYPGKISAVIYTQGCNFRCPFCHNPELVDPDLFQGTFDIEEIFTFLSKRKGRLEGVVVTGGEPLMHKETPDFLKRIKDMGYLVKLDTNGCFPDRLEYVLDNNLVDFIAMDFKAPYDKYQELTGVDVDIDKIKKSVELIREKAPDYEFRTTVVKKMLNKQDLLSIINSIEPAKKYVVQRFRSDSDILDDSIKHCVHTDDEFHEKKLYLKSYGFKTQVYFR